MMHRRPSRLKFKLPMLAMAAVMVVGLAVMTVNPRPAKALCETPAQSVVSLGLWLANSLGFLGDFGGFLTDFLTQDVQTGQDETRERVEEFDENTRAGLGTWHEEEHLPAMKDQAAQISVATIEDSRQRGSMIDGQEHMRRAREIMEAEAEAAQDMQPSEMACQADTIAAGGLTSGGGQSCSFNGGTYQDGDRVGQFSTSCGNGETTQVYQECCNGTVVPRQLTICGVEQTPDFCGSGPDGGNMGGIGASLELAENIARGSNNDASKRATAARGSPEATGMTAVVADKYQAAMSRYCDPNDNGGVVPCETPSPYANMDIQVGSSLLWGDDLTLDLENEQEKQLFEDAKRAFVDQETPQAIPPALLSNPQAVRQWNMIRSNAARKQAIHAVVGQILAYRTGRPESEPLPAVQEIRRAARIPEDQISDRPSVHEITQALFEERYMQPEFITQIIRSPEELMKQNLDVQTGHLMQWNMMYKNMERLSVMFASEFARDMEYSEADYTARDAPVGGTGSDYTREDIQNMIDPEGAEPPVCDIIEFDIPEDPFGMPDGSFDCTQASGDATGRPAGEYSISDTGLDLIKSYEKLELCPYDDGAGYMTIGWGHLIRRGESFGCISEGQASELLRRDLADAEAAVQRYVTADITQAQYDALVSLVFNIGAGNFAGCSSCTPRRPVSQVLVRTNAGDFEGAAEAFGSFVTAGGKRMRGLERRRNDEASLYSSACSGGDWGEAQSALARCIAQHDNAGQFNCAKGVANVLQYMGYPVQRGDASDWLDGRMEQNGWQQISCSPQTCPVGAVLVYDKNPGMTCRVTGTKGKDCGHVEVVTEVDGERRYVADMAYNTPGGSVPGNGPTAYVYTGPTTGYNNIPEECADLAGGM